MVKYVTTSLCNVQYFRAIFKTGSGESENRNGFKRIILKTRHLYSAALKRVTIFDHFTFFPADYPIIVPII